MDTDVVNLENAALLVVDMQQDFIDGSLTVPGGSGVIKAVNLWIEIFEDLERPILYSMDWHPAATPHFDRWPVHCVQETPGAQIHTDVIYDPIGMDKVYTVLKGLGQDDGYSALSRPSEIFGMSGSSRRLRHYGSVGTVLAAERATAVVLVGLATDYCVKATALDLVKQGFEVVLVVPATAGVTADSTACALEDMKRVGVRFVDLDGRLLPALDTLPHVCYTLGMQASA